MKVISLVPSYTEMLFSLGLGPVLAGVTEHCDFPPETRSIEKIGTFAGPRVDKVLALKPDLVCADPALHSNCIDRLKVEGINVYSPVLQTVDDVLRAMEDLAEMCNQREAVEKVVFPLRERLNSIKENARKKYHPRVFRIMSDNPVITPGPGSVQYDAIKLAGGTLMPVKNQPYLKVSWVELEDFDPEILLFCGRRKGEPKRPRCKGCYAKNPICQRTVDEIITGRWSGMTAVKHKNIFPLSCDILCRPGVRLIDGIEKLHRYFGSLDMQ